MMQNSNKMNFNHKWMSSLLLKLSLLFMFQLTLEPGVFKNHAFALANPQTPPIILGIIDSSPQKDFNEKILPYLKSELTNCSSCTMKNYTPYDRDQNFNPLKLADQIEKAGSEATLIYLGWNEKLSETNKNVVEVLKKVVESGKLIVSPTGFPADKEISAPLNKTVLGQIPKILIIGEMNEKERLLPKSFYGPEMLTALRLPKDLPEGIAPLMFASRLAENYKKHSHEEWLELLKNKKQKSRKIWPDLGDFF